MNPDEGYAEDLRVVNEHMRQIAVRAATSALADAIRAQGGPGTEVALPGPLAASTALGPHYETVPEPVTVHPVPVAARPTRWRWGVIEWCVPIFAIAAGAVMVFAIVALARAFADMAREARHAISAAAPGLSGIAGLIVLAILVILLFGRGDRGGGTFSGTFSGRMH